jgi:hypothetical protein
VRIFLEAPLVGIEAVRLCLLWTDKRHSVVGNQQQKSTHTRPYQQIPFQFSLHTLGGKGKLDAWSFIDLSGNDPSRDFAESLISVSGNKGPIFIYNAGFEGARIQELGERFPRLASDLLAIKRRLVDLLPVTR